MRIAIVSMDTRGGIQPYVALGLGLQRAGHDVRVVAPSDFAPMFAEVGLPMASLSGSVETVLRGSTGATERGAIASMRFVAHEMAAHIHAWTKETLEACEGVDIVTGGVGGMVVGLSVAEKLGKPFVQTHVQPVGARTGAYPGVLMSWAPHWLGSWGYRLSHHLSDAALWMPFRGGMSSARQKVLGLTGRPSAADGQPILYGFSRHVVSMPANDRERHVTGYWFLPASPTWSPPAALETFLAHGGPVACIGFGSMVSEAPGAVTKLVVKAARSAGIRAALLAGWGGLESIPQTDDVYVAEAVPHDWLYPRVTAIVHHGGAGTTGAALRAGVPAVVVPFTVDQPFWASRVKSLGVGPTPIPRSRLTSSWLADALRRAVADEAMRARAMALGKQIRAEDGIAEAVKYFGPGCG